LIEAISVDAQVCWSVPMPNEPRQEQASRGKS
jgi:hypothetical protein